MLLGILPPIIHIQSNPNAEALRWTLERMKHEVNAQRPGSTLVTQYLAYTLLVEAIRLHLEGDVRKKSGGFLRWRIKISARRLLPCMKFRQRHGQYKRLRSAPAFLEQRSL
jgi:hypothetical protein